MRETNLDIARRWVAAFNDYDVERLVGLYAEGARHTTPKLRKLSPQTGGQLVGRAALREWWSSAIQRTPGLRYELTAITADEARVFIEYVRHAPNEEPMLVAEVFEVQGGQIVASRVYHG